eukprot:m51a1_g14810 hypothetical protein (196) ;mRNA; f:599239-599980
MSSSVSTGPPKKGPPKHQNTFAFRHNPHSRKTNAIASLPNEGLCQHCADVIEWRKKYRKYKPLSQPASCTLCKQKTVTHAYHTVCPACARAKGICGKCAQTRPVIKEVQSDADRQREEQMLKDRIKEMSERERRAFYRQLDKEQQEEEGEGGCCGGACKQKHEHKGGDHECSSCDDSDCESCDDDDDDDDEGESH